MWEISQIGVLQFAARAFVRDRWPERLGLFVGFGRLRRVIANPNGMITFRY